MSGQPPTYESSSSSSSLAASRLSESARHSPSLSSLFRKSRSGALQASIVEDVRVAVQPNSGSVDERVALLTRCAKLCTQHKIDLAALLQEQSFHKHTALYWAIVNNPGPTRGPFDLVAAVVTHSGALKQDTIKEARQACLSMGNQQLFQFLRMCPEFGVLSEEDRFLLDTVVPPEEIELEEMEGPDQPFCVRFKIPLYKKRMMLAKQIKLEFIARERMWCFWFFTPVNSPMVPLASSPTQWYNEGQWGTSLQLVEDMSRSTYMQCAMVLLDERKTGDKPAHAWSLGWPPKPLRGGSEVCDEETYYSSWWPTFGEGLQGERPCIAEDGSIRGIMGVKLLKMAEKPQNWPPARIPTEPDEECVVC